MYTKEIENIYEKIIHTGKNADFIKIKLIELFQKLIESRDLNRFLRASEIDLIKDYLYQASVNVNNEDELENLIDKRCELWDYHDSSEGNKKQLLRVLVYTMYAYRIEGYDNDLYELIANIILDLDKVDENFVDKFIQEILFNDD